MTPTRRGAGGGLAHSITPAVGQGSRRTRGYSSGKEDYLLRLRKIEGQVRGMQKMVEDDVRCPDVVVQIGSATRALQEVAVGLLTEHLRHCAPRERHADPGSTADQYEEIAAAIRGVVRL